MPDRREIAAALHQHARGLDSGKDHRTCWPARVRPSSTAISLPDHGTQTKAETRPRGGTAQPAGLSGRGTRKRAGRRCFLAGRTRYRSFLDAAGARRSQESIDLSAEAREEVGRQRRGMGGSLRGQTDGLGVSAQRALRDPLRVQIHTNIVLCESAASVRAESARATRSAEAAGTSTCLCNRAQANSYRSDVSFRDEPHRVTRRFSPHERRSTRVRRRPQGQEQSYGGDGGESSGHGLNYESIRINRGRVDVRAGTPCEHR